MELENLKTVAPSMIQAYERLLTAIGKAQQEAQRLEDFIGAAKAVVTINNREGESSDDEP